MVTDKEGDGADADGPIGKPESALEKQQGGIAVTETDLNFAGNMPAAGHSGPSSRPCSIPVSKQPAWIFHHDSWH